MRALFKAALSLVLLYNRHRFFFIALIIPKKLCLINCKKKTKGFSAAKGQDEVNLGALRDILLGECLVVQASPQTRHGEKVN